MIKSRIIAIVTTIMAIIVFFTSLYPAYAATTATNVTLAYTSDYTPTLVNLVVLPGVYQEGFYSKTSSCTAPLPSLATRIGPFLVTFFRDTEGHHAGTSVTYWYCGGAEAAWSSPFPYSNYTVLVATCESTPTEWTDTSLVDLTTSDYYAVVYDYAVKARVINVTVSVRLFFVWPSGSSGTYYVWLETDEGEELLGSSDASGVYQAFNIYTSRLAVRVNASTTASYYYVVVSVDVWYEPPVYNETRIVVGNATLFYVLYGGGPGYIASGTINVTVNGNGTIIFTPEVSGVNGTVLDGAAGSNVTLGVWCYGSGVESRLYAIVWYANASSANVYVDGTLYSTVTAATLANITLSLAGLNMSVNLTPLTEAIRNQTLAYIGVFGVTLGGAALAAVTAAMILENPLIALPGMLVAMIGAGLSMTSIGVYKVIGVVLGMASLVVGLAALFITLLRS